MSEKVYWGVTTLVTAALIVAGIRFYPPLLTGLHVIVSLVLLLVVLLQSGRAADLAGAFGGTGSQTAFGPRGAANFLSKSTTFLAVVFMVTSLSLAIFSSGRPASSLAEQAAPAQEQTEQEEAPAPDQGLPPLPDEAPPGTPPADQPPPPAQE